MVSLKGFAKKNQLPAQQDSKIDQVEPCKSIELEPFSKMLDLLGIASIAAKANKTWWITTIVTEKTDTSLAPSDD